MCPEKQRSHDNGYNVGDAMAFVNMEPYNKAWQAEMQKKRAIYGARAPDDENDPPPTHPHTRLATKLFAPHASGLLLGAHPLLQCGWHFGLGN